MQAIDGFDNIQAAHGRNGGPLPGGTYVMLITACKEDVTGYGNQCLKVAYDVVDGEHAGKYADIANDPEQNWRHEVEIDTQELNGGRLKALIDAVVASNPGYVWDWNEAGLVGKIVGLILQERKQTNTKGKRKGQTSTYLDFWDAVPAQSVRSGEINFVPPVNDKRTNMAQQAEMAAAVPPVAVPQSYGQPVVGPAVPPTPATTPAPSMQGAAIPPAAPPVQTGFGQQQMPMAQPQYQQPMQQPQYQQPMQQPVQAPNVTGVYDEDIPFN